LAGRIRGADGKLPADKFPTDKLPIDLERPSGSRGEPRRPDRVAPAPDSRPIAGGARPGGPGNPAAPAGSDPNLFRRVRNNLDRELRQRLPAVTPPRNPAEGPLARGPNPAGGAFRPGRGGEPRASRSNSSLFLGFNSPNSLWLGASWNSSYGWRNDGAYRWRYAYSPWGCDVRPGRFGWNHLGWGGSGWGGLGWGGAWGGYGWSDPVWNQTAWYTPPPRLFWRRYRPLTVAPVYCALGHGNLGFGLAWSSLPWLLNWGFDRWSTPAPQVLYSPGYVYDYNPDCNYSVYTTDLSYAAVAPAATVVPPEVIDLNPVVVEPAIPLSLPTEPSTDLSPRQPITPPADPATPGPLDEPPLGAPPEPGIPGDPPGAAPEALRPPAPDLPTDEVGRPALTPELPMPAGFVAPQVLDPADAPHEADSPPGLAGGSSPATGPQLSGPGELEVSANGAAEGGAPAAGSGPATTPEVDEDDRESARVFADKGEQDFKAGNYKGAVYSWKHALVDDPENGVIVLMFSQALLATGEFPQAAGAVQQAIQLLPTEQWGVVIENFRELYGKAGDYSAQIKSLEKAMKDAPEEPALRFLAGYHYLYLGYPKQSIDQLDRVLKSAPRDQVAKKLREVAVKKLKEAEEKAASDAPPKPGDPAS